MFHIINHATVFKQYGKEQGSAAEKCQTVQYLGQGMKDIRYFTHKDHCAAQKFVAQIKA